MMKFGLCVENCSISGIHDRRMADRFLEFDFFDPIIETKLSFFRRSNPQTLNNPGRPMEAQTIFWAIFEKPVKN
jgi:hypothetical protein